MKKLSSILVLGLFSLALVLNPAGSAEAKTHSLPATPATTWTGYFDNSIPPVLTINSGDVLDTQTLALYNDKLIPGLTIADVVKLRADLAAEKKTSHTMTGPVFINGAEPGDVLEIKILKLVPRPYAVNYNIPGNVAKVGTIPEDFPDGQVKDFALDLKKLTTKFNNKMGKNK
jgi:acetamidase/formamidase